jgi:glyoxalase/bleomycin resistance protein/dioxygenase superfamily protein
MDSPPSPADGHGPPPPPEGDGQRVVVTSTVLDHVAVAVERWADAWPWYIERLGGSWYSGGINIGFSPAQLGFANKAKVEVLQPWEPERNLFLRRFLDHSGPGPHHLTFKVPDIQVMLERIQAAGYEAINVNLSDPIWQEAFLHPRQATGVVVQVAQAEYEWISPEPEGFPEGSGVAPSTLRHVAHAVADMDGALGLFHRLLGGVVTGRAVGRSGAWEYVDLTWPGPLGVRLMAPTAGADADTPLVRWLGNRPGRVHHLAFELPGALPAAEAWADQVSPGVGDVPGVTSDPGTFVVVAAEHNLGTALVLSQAGS